MNQPLQQRAGRNIGIETLPVFLQAAGAPEIVVPITGAGTYTTLLEAVEGVLRTPFTRGEEAGFVFNLDASACDFGVFFEDDAGNRMLIAVGSVDASGTLALDLSVNGSAVNPFTPAKPLCLFDGEKIVITALVGGG
jgi:hypothetical protein